MTRSASEDYPEHGYTDELTPKEWRRLKIGLARGAVTFVLGFVFLATIIPPEWVPMDDDDVRSSPHHRGLIAGLVLAPLIAAVVPGRIGRPARVTLATLLVLLVCGAHFLWRQ